MTQAGQFLLSPDRPASLPGKSPDGLEKKARPLSPGRAIPGLSRKKANKAGLSPVRSQVEEAVTDFYEKDPIDERYSRSVELHVFSEVGGDSGVRTFLFKVQKSPFQFLPQKFF